MFVVIDDDDLAVEEEASDEDLVIERIKHDRALLARQRRSSKRTLEDLYHCIRDGLDLGMSATTLSKLSGVSVPRIYQIKDFR
jgi:hypothetical protein